MAGGKLAHLVVRHLRRCLRIDGGHHHGPAVSAARCHPGRGCTRRRHGDAVRDRTHGEVGRCDTLCSPSCWPCPARPLPRTQPSPCATAPARRPRHRRMASGLPACRRKSVPHRTALPQASPSSSLRQRIRSAAGACSSCRCPARATTGRASAGRVPLQSNCGWRTCRKLLPRNPCSRASISRWPSATTTRQTGRAWSRGRQRCCNGRRMSAPGWSDASRTPKQQARDRRGRKSGACTGPLHRLNAVIRQRGAAGSRGLGCYAVPKRAADKERPWTTQLKPGT